MASTPGVNPHIRECGEEENNHGGMENLEFFSHEDTKTRRNMPAESVH